MNWDLLRSLGRVQREIRRDDRDRLARAYFMLSADAARLEAAHVAVADEMNRATRAVYLSEVARDEAYRHAKYPKNAEAERILRDDALARFVVDQVTERRHRTSAGQMYFAPPPSFDDGDVY